MESWLSQKTRHDTLLNENRSKSARASAIHTEETNSHIAHHGLINDILSKQAAFAKEKSDQLQRRFLAKKKLLSTTTFRDLDKADENLLRLGLDEQSQEQEQAHGRNLDNVAQFAFVVESGVSESPLPTPADDAMSGRASAYSRKSRKTVTSSQNVHLVHPLVGGVSALLRNAAATGNLKKHPIVVHEHLEETAGRVKLAPPLPCYPTVCKPRSDQQTDSDHSGSDESVYIDDLKQSDGYMEDIRTRKYESTVALRERHVRHHRLKSEQQRSRNEISEKKCLEDLLRDARIGNLIDKQETLKTKAKWAEEAHTEHLKEMLLEISRKHLSKMAQIELDRNALLAEKERTMLNAEFSTMRHAKKEREKERAATKRELRLQFCEGIVEGIISLVEEVVLRGTQHMHDGTIQYRRATFAPTEWKLLKQTAIQSEKQRPIHLEAEPPLSATSVDIKTSPSPKTTASATDRKTQTLNEDVMNGFLENLSQCDLDWVRNQAMREKAPSLAPENMGITAFTAVFVVGDPVVSGVSLLENLCNTSLKASPRYIVLTPKLLRRLFLQRSLQSVDRALDDANERRDALQSEVAKLPPQTKSKPKDGRGKETSGGQAIAAQISDIGIRIASLHGERDKVIKDYSGDLSDLHAAGILADVLNSRNAPATNDGIGFADSELSADSLGENNDLRQATLLLVGFPQSGKFWEALSEGLNFKPHFTTAALMMDAATYICRQNERELYYLRGSGEEAPQHPATKKPSETIIAHPLFSPLLTNSEDLATHRRLTFVRNLSWRDECEDSETDWLINLLRHGPPCNNLEIGPSANIAICFDETLNGKLVEGIQFDKTKSLEGLWDQEAQTNAACLMTVRDRICDIVCDTIALATDVSVEKQAHREILDDTTSRSFRALSSKVRRSFFEALLSLQSASEDVHESLVRSGNAYFENSNRLSDTSFDWLHVCDGIRRESILDVGEIVSTLRHKLDVCQTEATDAMQNLKIVFNSHNKPLPDKVADSIFLLPFSILNDATRHLGESAATCVKSLFDAHTLGSGSTTPPTSSIEMLCSVDPHTNLKTNFGEKTCPTSVQSYFFHEVLLTLSDETMTPADRQRSVSLLKMLPRVCPSFFPVSLLALSEHVAVGQDITRAAFATAVICGRLEGQLGTPFANPLEISKLMLSLRNCQGYSAGEFSSLAWWFDAAVAKNLSKVFVVGGRLALPDLLQFVCSNDSGNPAAIFQMWVNAISIFTGRSQGSELSIMLSEMPKFFSPTVFDKKGLALLDFLQGNLSSGGTLNTQNFLNTSFGRHLLSTANLHPPKL